MKKAHINWNKEHIEDKDVFLHLENLSNGKIKIELKMFYNKKLKVKISVAKTRRNDFHFKIQFIFEFRN